MKKFSVLVKQVLMSTATVGLFATAFTACSDEVETLDSQSAAATDFTAKANDPLLEPIGLVYNDFITPNDVEILNADTTEIAISKALADKKGITNFVNHPMGIWSDFNELSYLRRATSQKLVGDRYILKVVRSGIGEIVRNQDAEFNTKIFVNPSADKTRGGAGSKYTDANNVIHPVAVSITRLPGEPAAATRSGRKNYGTLTAEQILDGETFNLPQTRGVLDDVKKYALLIANFALNGGEFDGQGHGRALGLHGTAKLPKICLKTGKNEGDTVTINTTIPYDFDLDYTLKLNADYDFPIDVDVNYFEGRLDGHFKIAPEMTVGIAAKASLPKEKQNHKLCDLGDFNFFFMAGCVPIAVTVQPHLDLHIEASVEGKVYTGVKYEYESQFSAGVKYNGSSWSPILKHEVKKSDLGIISPRGTFKANAGIGILLGCDVLIDYLAGPTLSVGPMVTANLNGKFAPTDKNPFTFSAGIDAGVMGRAGVKVKLWKLEILDWQTDLKFGPQWNLWSYKYDGNTSSSNGGNACLNQQIEDLKKEAESQKAEAEAKAAAEAAAKKAAEEAARKAASEKNWNTFVAMMQNDPEVQNLLKQFKAPGFMQVGFNPNPVNTPEKLFKYALNKTLSWHDTITLKMFPEMRSQLINVIKSEVEKSQMNR